MPRTRRKTKNTEWKIKGLYIGFTLLILQLLCLHFLGDGSITAKLFIFNVAIFIATGLVISYFLYRPKSRRK